MLTVLADWRRCATGARRLPGTKPAALESASAIVSPRNMMKIAAG